MPGSTAAAQESARAAPRVCVCVLMNHPFPDNLPLLRRLYAERFTALRFLIPFERLPDEDVITVYRGSYAHAAYLTDARRELAAIACDYYVVVHDDVLLNPRLAEATFFDSFPLGADDGFIGHVSSTPDVLHAWPWYAGFVAKLLYPKSILFGTGIEPATLARYLPDPDALRAALVAHGAKPSDATHIQPDAMTRESLAIPSRRLLHGLSRALPATAAQEAVERLCADAERLLASGMLADQRVQGATAEADERVPLPIPTVTSGYKTDFYILPKSGFDAFCHYVGVAGAANLFVEIMAPTLLHACCAKVWSSDALGLDLSGFDEAKLLTWFRAPDATALHPFKLSLFRTETERAHLLATLARIAAGQSPAPGSPLAHAAFGRWLLGFLGDEPGWQEGEHWGVWAAAREAVIPLALSKPGCVRVVLRAPLAGANAAMHGRLVYNQGREVLPVTIALAAPQVELVIDRLEPDADGVARIRLCSDTLVRPCDIDPVSRDERSLGLGLVMVEAIG